MQGIKSSKFNDLQDYASYYNTTTTRSIFGTNTSTKQLNKNSPNDLQMKQESTIPQELAALKEMHEKQELKTYSS